MVRNKNNFSQNIQNKYQYRKAENINVNLENKAKKLFSALGLNYQKIPTLTHNEQLPDNIEGVYKRDTLTLRKNPRVSDKKVEAVAMHEIYHHTQRNEKLTLKEEEATANMIEKVYLNENQKNVEKIDFDLIYAYTIKQFYEHDELEKLIYIIGGSHSNTRKIYHNAMHTIIESKSNKDKENKCPQYQN